MPQLPELIERKVLGAEKSILNEADVPFHQQEYERLCQALNTTSNTSSLPDTPSAKEALNELLIQVRMGIKR